MLTLDDFFGDGSVACKAADDATKGTPITPTWDEAMETEPGYTITRPAGPDDTCFTCRARIDGNVAEIAVSPVETRFYCEFCAGK